MSGPTSSTTGGAGPVLPPGQEGAAGALGSIFSQMPQSPGATPGGWAYPMGQAVYPWFDPQTWGAQNWQQGTDLAASYGWPLFSTMSAAPGTLVNAGNQTLGYLSPLMQNAFSPAYGQEVANAQGIGGALGNYANQIMQQGFDPQNALFQQQQTQLMNQAAAMNAASGVAGTPYGSSVSSNAMGNFDINWQNNQLQREAMAAGAANPLYAASIGLPLQALNAQNLAGIQGASGAASLLGAGTGAFQGAQNLGLGLGQGIAGLEGLPYQAGTAAGNQALGALGNIVNLGNQQYVLPQQLMSDLMQYLGLGQSASALSASLGQNQWNNLSSGIGGAMSAFGPFGPFGSFGAFGGGGGLFGGGGGLFGGGAGALGSGIADFGGGGAALGIPDVGGVTSLLGIFGL